MRTFGMVEFFLSKAIVPFEELDFELSKTEDASEELLIVSDELEVASAIEEFFSKRLEDDAIWLEDETIRLDE